MRALTTIALILTAVYYGVSAAHAAQPSVCKPCRDQQRACMANYPSKTCQTEYDICVKACRGKS